MGYFLRIAALLFAMVCLLSCSKVQASPTLENSLNLSRGSLDVHRLLKRSPTKKLKTVEEIARQSQDVSICERKEKNTVFAFGQCPESCEPFTFELFSTCAGMTQFGCVLDVCGPGQFKCSLNENPSDDVTVCSGGRIIFDSVKLERLQTVQYSIDLKLSQERSDFFLLADATRELTTASRSIKKAIQHIVREISSSADVAFGIGLYHNGVERDGGFKNVQSLTTDMSTMQAAVESLFGAGGGDVDVDENMVALHRVASDPSIGWRDQSRKILMVFGELCGQDSPCVNGMPTSGREQVVNALNENEIEVMTVSLPPGLDRAVVGAEQGKSLTVGKRSARQAEDDQAELKEFLGEFFGRLERTFDVDGSECERYIGSVHEPKLPLKVVFSVPFGATRVTNRLRIKPNVCGSIGEFECSYRYSEKGRDTEKTVVEIVKVRGCV